MQRLQVHSACLTTSPANNWTMQDWRPTIFALRAFHVEIASIADHVKEALVVPMRMQWWRDAVNSLYKGTPIRHPVIQCLAQVHMVQLEPEHVPSGTPNDCITCVLSGYAHEYGLKWRALHDGTNQLPALDLICSDAIRL